MSEPRFVLWRSKNDSKYYFNFKAANNEIIVWSEGYNQKLSAIEAIQLIKIYAEDAPIKDLT